jgi:hypothetical protein
MSLRRIAIAVQGLYYVGTGVWPLVHMPSFEAVTGTKIEHWLVHTVGVLAAAIGLALLAGARRAAPTAETVVLACAAAGAFAGIDVFYTQNGTISRIYLADAAVQGVLVLAILVGRGSGSPAY